MPSELSPEQRARLEAMARRSRERVEFIERLPMIHEEYRAEMAWRMQEVSDIEHALASYDARGERIGALEEALRRIRLSANPAGSATASFDLIDHVASIALATPPTALGEGESEPKLVGWPKTSKPKVDVKEWLAVQDDTSPAQPDAREGEARTYYQHCGETWRAEGFQPLSECAVCGDQAVRFAFCLPNEDEKAARAVLRALNPTPPAGEA